MDTLLAYIIGIVVFIIIVIIAALLLITILWAALSYWFDYVIDPLMKRLRK